MINSSLICNNISLTETMTKQKYSITNIWEVTNVIILFTLMSKSGLIGDTKKWQLTVHKIVSSLEFSKHKIIVVWLHCSVSHDTVTWPPVEMSHGITPYLNPVGV